LDLRGPNFSKIETYFEFFATGSKLVGEVDVIEEQNNNVSNEENNVSNISNVSYVSNISNVSNEGESSGNDSAVSKASVYDELFSSDED
jgi:hypothetical protein